MCIFICYSCVNIYSRFDEISSRWRNVYFPARYHYTTEEEEGAVREGALGYLVVFGYCVQSISVCFGVLILIMLSCPHQSAHILCFCRPLPNCLFLSSGVESVVGACKPCGFEKRHWFPLIFVIALESVYRHDKFSTSDKQEMFGFLNISFHQHDISSQKWT